MASELTCPTPATAWQAFMPRSRRHQDAHAGGRL